MSPEVKAVSDVVGIFLQYGLLGALCVIEAVVIYKLNGKIDAKDVRIGELHQARLDDAKACSASHVAVLDKQFETNGKTAAVLDGIERLLDKLPFGKTA